jgi:hypothetical protein
VPLQWRNSGSSDCTSASVAVEPLLLRHIYPVTVEEKLYFATGAITNNNYQFEFRSISVSVIVCPSNVIRFERYKSSEKL